jgi:prolipoprotein diacylglyceryltransferase
LNLLKGRFENALGLFSTGQWLSIPFILIGLYFVIKAKKIRQTFSYTKERYFNIDLTLFFWHKKNANSDC